jgi:hypothetical protein
MKRRISPFWAGIGSLLSAGIIAWAILGGRAWIAVKRDQATMAAVDAQKPAALLALRVSEQERLQAGPLPIDEAMSKLATQGRAGLGSALTPQPSTDTAPLMGWGYQVHDVPDWMMAAPDAGDGGP